MRFIFKVIIVFLIIFNWRIPYLYNSVVVAILLLLLYYIITKGTIPVTYFFRHYNVVILIATIFLGGIILSISIVHNTVLMSGLEKRIWVQFMMLWAMIFAIPLLIDGKEFSAFEEISVVVCYAFALQGLIHLTGYLVPSIGEFLLKMKPEELQQAVMEPGSRLEKFRLYALTGSVFFELPAAYGVACILFFRILLIENQRFIFGWLAYVIIFLMITGISLSGRTGFVGLSLGVLLWLIAYYQRIINFIIRNSWQIVGAIVVFLLVFNFVLPSKHRQRFQDEVFPFAFEAYYNWQETGNFSTSSTDVNFSEAFYYPLRDETLLIGHGLERGKTELVGYKSTDAGYMGSIIFGGIPFLICLIIYQGLYFIQPLSIANRGGKKEDRNDFYCLLFLFVYMFFLHSKESAMGTLHIVETLLILIGSVYMTRYYYNVEEMNELSE